ncbi:MAG: exodeoxyribonuclease V subunit alpha [Deltaproteobacteria bacterium]|nr:exodeoxyribonuclease V subunit alpha [Deltaproteobacteria bacterium]
MKRIDLDRLFEQGMISPLDIRFARFMEQLSGKENPDLCLAAALVCKHTRQGHVCLDIAGMGGKPLGNGEDRGPALACPEPEKWCNHIENTSVVGIPGEYTPLILDRENRLYLLRYWEYQQGLADFIKGRIQDAGDGIDRLLLKEGLGRLFPSGLPAVDWQRVAAGAACLKRLSVITGGPGTGKTTTVARILVLLMEQAFPGTLKIALVSPTGKGAARLQEAMVSARSGLQCTDAIQEAMPAETSTIHRLLGTIPGSPYFRHNEKNPLPLDVLVVDEASMVDMALMSKTVRALPPQARLILLGDKDQLASVEAGAVLGDICDTGNEHPYSHGFFRELKSITGYDLNSGAGEGDEKPGLQDSIVELKKSYRFGAESGIRILSQAVNEGDQDRAWSILNNGEQGDVAWRKLPGPDGLQRLIKEIVSSGFTGGMHEKNPMKTLGLFERYRNLCGLREGPYGVDAMNRLIQRILKREGHIRPHGQWYAGQPIMVTQNDYDLGVFNGDTGIILEDPERDHDLRAFFPSPEGGLKKIHPIRLPEHETVYAMTVHKSQGSEFDRVLLILPDRDSPVLSRELIYTAITRAREHVEVWGTEGVFRAAVGRRTERTSGLRDALWNT